MSRFGDTPQGMVEACMEYLRICEKVDFKDIILSIKASNTRIMVYTVRLLVATMKSVITSYSIHYTKLYDSYTLCGTEHSAIDGQDVTGEIGGIFCEI